MDIVMIIGPLLIELASRPLSGQPAIGMVTLLRNRALDGMIG